ncbi:MAG: hypothetical protein ACTTH8_04120 [Treponema sp.]
MSASDGGVLIRNEFFKKKNSLRDNSGGTLVLTISRQEPDTLTFQ